MFNPSDMNNLWPTSLGHRSFAGDSPGLPPRTSPGWKTFSSRRQKAHAFVPSNKARALIRRRGRRGNPHAGGVFTAISSKPFSIFNVYSIITRLFHQCQYISLDKLIDIAHSPHKLEFGIFRRFLDMEESPAGTEANAGIKMPGSIRFRAQVP
jgi:hypothetical protein